MGGENNKCVCVCVCIQLRMGILYMVCVLHILAQNHKVLLHSELNGYMTKEHKLKLMTDTATLMTITQQLDE